MATNYFACYLDIRPLIIVFSWSEDNKIWNAREDILKMSQCFYPYTEVTGVCFINNVCTVDVVL